ncbi:DUF4397 domain-containing protein [Lapillicoccus sp.]|uniref:DUF4397 domain-containing protein n=1 Tax=Lapillicoccus sp. TaxID=1909287 RepID=UPI003263590A
MRIMPALGALTLAAAASIGAAVAAPSAQAAGTAQVSILHAVPDTPVDVYANGKALLTNFTPGTLAGPLSLPSGSYDLKVTKVGAGAGGAAVIEAKGVNVPPNVNVTVVAHLSATGTPELTPYVNDTSMVPAGKARLTVRHTAAAPAVDVRAGGTPVFTGLTNPGEKSGVVAAGTVSADVVLAGTSTVVIGPANLTLKEGTNTIVYAWGSADAKNLKLAVQTISGMHSSPGGVPAGDGGQAAGSGSSAPAIALVLLGGLAAGGLVLVSTRRRSQVRATSV